MKKIIIGLSLALCYIAGLYSDDVAAYRLGSKCYDVCEEVGERMNGWSMGWYRTFATHADCICGDGDASPVWRVHLIGDKVEIRLLGDAYD